MGALTPRQNLAEQLGIHSSTWWPHHKSSATWDCEHPHFEVCLSDKSLVNKLQRFGFDLHLLSYSKRLDPWAATEIIGVGNPQQLRQQPAVVDICIYEVELPVIAEVTE